jgi:hypothetical protein
MPPTDISLSVCLLSVSALSVCPSVRVSLWPALFGAAAATKAATRVVVVQHERVDFLDVIKALHRNGHLV